MQRIPCYLEFDESTNVVTIRHATHKTIQMMIKLEAGSEGTMKRVVPMEDCDNFWLGVKPSDDEVFNNLLMGRKKFHSVDIRYILD